MAQTEAQKRAKDKYNKKTYKQLKANIKFADYDMIEEYCTNNNISKAKLIINSIKYCIENNINLFDTQENNQNNNTTDINN